MEGVTVTVYTLFSAICTYDYQCFGLEKATNKILHAAQLKLFSI